MSEKEINEIVKEYYGFTVEEMDESLGKTMLRVKQLEYNNEKLREKNTIYKSTIKGQYNKIKELQNAKRISKKVQKERKRKLQEENQKLKKKLDKAIELLIEYNMPCEMNDFMNKNVDYCSSNCGVDEEVYKKCWLRYIEQELEK